MQKYFISPYHWHNRHSARSQFIAQRDAQASHPILKRESCYTKVDEEGLIHKYFKPCDGRFWQYSATRVSNGRNEMIENSSPVIMDCIFQSNLGLVEDTFD